MKISQVKDRPMVPMVEVGGRGRRVPLVGFAWLDSELERARDQDEDFFAALEDSRLAIPGEADMEECIAIASRAPSVALRGYVLGLLSNNFRR